MIKTDELDEAIIEMLQIDGRISNREIGRSLDVPESTIRNRLKKLFDSKALRLGVVMSPEAHGIAVVAYVYLKIAPKNLRHAAERIAASPQVAYLAITAGQHDLVAIATAADEAALMNFIHETVEPMEGVFALKVRQLSYTLKHSFTEVRIA